MTDVSVGRLGTEHQGRSLFKISAEKAISSVSTRMSNLKSFLKLL